MNYNIQRISSDRLKDLVPLYADVFNKKVALEYFQRKFSTEIFGAAHIGYIAYDERNSPAAYYGLFPCLVELNGEKILSATSGDTMTHSAHRGKGLFVDLAKRTYALAKESGIRFAFGFPNEHSLKGSIQLGWQYKGDTLRLFSLKVNTLPLAKLAKKIKLGDALFGRSSEDHFPNSLMENGSGGVLHDADYFKYKAFTPKSIFMIAGVRVWLKVDGVMKVGDVERIMNFNVKAFISEMKKFAFKRGITEVQFMVSNDTWLEKELSKELKGMDAFQVGHFYLDCEGLDLSKMKYGMGDLDTY